MEIDIFDKKGILPMLIAEQVEPYDDPDSIFELKLDGIRCIAYCDSNSVDLRNKRDICLLPRFPELSELYQMCKEKCILDGELIVPVNGKPDFYEVQKRTLLTDPFKMQLLYTKHPACFVTYDILYYKDHSTDMLPLMERKQLLQDVITETNMLSVSRYIDTNGSAFFELAKQQQLEGVVGKKKASLYWFGKRTKDWKKVKVMADYEAIAIGYIHKQNNTTSLIMAQYNENDELVITNYVTLGVSLSKLRQQGLQPGPCLLMNNTYNYDDNIHWIKPLVCTIEYMPTEGRDGLRQAVFKGVRDDKEPWECKTNSTRI